jgi:hypothetical protein
MDRWPFDAARQTAYTESSVSCLHHSSCVGIHAMNRRDFIHVSAQFLQRPFAIPEPSPRTTKCLLSGSRCAPTGSATKLATTSPGYPQQYWSFERGGVQQKSGSRSPAYHRYRTKRVASEFASSSLSASGRHNRYHLRRIYCGARAARARSRARKYPARKTELQFSNFPQQARP